MRKSRVSLTFIIVLLNALCASAQTPRSDRERRNVAPTVGSSSEFPSTEGYNFVAPPRNYSTAQGTFASTPADHIGVRSLPVATNISFSQAYFSDQKNGWFFDPEEFDQSGRILKTTDGGISLTPITIPVDRGASLADISFADDQNGWVLVNYGNCYLSIPPCRSQVLSTKNGGRDWKPEFAVVSTHLDQVRFLDSKYGWIAGGVFSGGRSRAVLLVTNDDGKVWKDAAAKLSDVEAFADSNFLVSAFHIADSKAVTIATFGGKIFRTLDGGDTWSQYGPDFHLPRNFTFNLNAIPGSEKLFTWTGVHDWHGLQSYLATEDGNGRWNVRWLGSSGRLKDLVFLTGSDVLASFVDAGDYDEAAINSKSSFYLSRDGGATWKPVQGVPENFQINSLTRLTKNKALAIGNSRILKIEIEDITSKGLK